MHDLPQQACRDVQGAPCSLLMNPRCTVDGVYIINFEKPLSKLVV